MTTVCELGASSAHSAITWLESAPWVTVYSFERPVPGAGTGDGSFDYAGDVSGRDAAGISVMETTFLEHNYGRRFKHLQIPGSPADLEQAVPLMASTNMIPS